MITFALAIFAGNSRKVLKGWLPGEVLAAFFVQFLSACCPKDGNANLLQIVVSWRN